MKNLVSFFCLTLLCVAVYAQDIYGQWRPVENSDYTLNISKYGTFKSSSGYSESYLFTIKDDIVTIKTDAGAIMGEMRVVVTGEGDNRVLEIYNNTKYAGKYQLKTEKQLNASVGCSLIGRVAISLPSPSIVGDTEGKVVVKIWVDRDGNVKQVSAPEKGSTLTDQAYVNAVKDAAMKAQFASASDAPELQTGTLSYVFRIN